MTTLGRQQVAQLAEFLAEAGIEHMYYSPLRRAIQTADMLAKAWQVSAESMPTIRERNRYGVLSGLTRAEAAQRYPEQVRLLKNVHNTVLGGESYADFWQRVAASLQMVAQSRQFERVGIVTHGGPISSVVREMLQLGEVTIADCGFLVIEFEGLKLKLLDSHGIRYLDRKSPV